MKTEKNPFTVKNDKDESHDKEIRDAEEFFAKQRKKKQPRWGSTPVLILCTSVNLVLAAILYFQTHSSVDVSTAKVLNDAQSSSEVANTAAIPQSQCDSSCLTCVGTGTLDCTSCAPNFKLNKLYGESGACLKDANAIAKPVGDPCDNCWDKCKTTLASCKEIPGAFNGCAKGCPLACKEQVEKEMCGDPCDNCWDKCENTLASCKEIPKAFNGCAKGCSQACKDQVKKEMCEDGNEKQDSTKYIDVAAPDFSDLFHFVTELLLPSVSIMKRQTSTRRFVIHREKMPSNNNPWEFPYDYFDSILDGLSQDVHIETSKDSPKNAEKGAHWQKPWEWKPKDLEQIKIAIDHIKELAPKTSEKVDIIFQIRSDKRLSSRGVKNMQKCADKATSSLNANVRIWKGDISAFWEDVAIYKRAKTVILMHGGDMVHTFWMNSGVKNVIEYMPKSKDLAQQGFPRNQWMDGISKHLDMNLHRMFVPELHPKVDCQKLISILQSEFGYTTR